MDQKLRPFERLQRPREFRRVFKTGRCYRTQYLRIHYSPSGGDYSRLGLVVRRKVGNSVIRSRLKRYLRELFRRNKYALPLACDVVLIPQESAQDYDTYKSVYDGFIQGAQRRSSKASRSRPLRASNDATEKSSRVPPSRSSAMS